MVQCSYDELNDHMELENIQQQKQVAEFTHELEASKREASKNAKAADDAEESLLKAEGNLTATEQMNSRHVVTKDNLNMKLRKSAEELQSAHCALEKELSAHHAAPQTNCLQALWADSM